MNLIEELKRRKVFRVAAVYAVVAWVLIQIADTVSPALQLPDWTVSLVTVLLILGLVPTVIAAWAYEITPEGVKRESEVDRSQSISGHTGKKLDRIIIGFLVLAVAVLLIDRSMSPAGKGPATLPEDATVQMDKAAEDKPPLQKEALPSED